MPDLIDDLAEQLADARHELDVLRGGIADFSERLDLALGDLTRALRERDEARDEVADWKHKAHNARVERDRQAMDIVRLIREREEARATLAAPGWESPAALQEAYNEILAMHEQAEAERDRRGDELRRAQGVIEALGGPR